jgi:ethanolamine ammonia-lyase large subunit
MSYGKVISGGAKMSKGLTKGINDKLSGFASENGRRQVVATAVLNAFKVKDLSDNSTNNVKGGKFTSPKVPTKG